MCKYMYVRYSKKKTPFSRAKGVLHTYLHKKEIYIYILAPPGMYLPDVNICTQGMNLPTYQLLNTQHYASKPSDRFAYRRTQAELRAEEWWGSEEVAGR